MPEPSGSFDDVAAAALAGVSPFVIAICGDLGSCAALASWLETAIPSLGDRHTRRCPAEELELQVSSSLDARGVILVVDDAASGDDASFSGRFRSWNSARDRLRVGLGAPGSGNAVILLMTRRRMPEAAALAPDLLSVSHVLTVAEEPFALRPAQEEAIGAFRAAQRELEQRYGLSTDELVQRLFDREPIDIPDLDLNRWKAVAQALRDLDPA
ncbi:MAG TPA: hypothetical protein VLS89_08800 [Candidatus Nanopelagicales bacterium]|nr:hypothetical protein [Candidatus Nanopelagicales bacterium]